MKEIYSKDNQHYKLYQKLESKKYRDKFGLYLIEGENLIEEAYKNGARIESVMVRADMTGRLVKPWLDGADVFSADGKLFDSLAQTKTSQGILAAVRKPDLSLNDFLNGSSNDFPERGSAGNFVVLDRLQDPGNIGTIIRTADAAGYGLVIAVKGTADVFSPKVVRAAAGSLFRMKIAFADNEEELVRFIKAAGKKLVATSLTGSRYYCEEDLSSDIALVIGNEGGGVSESLAERSDLKIKIPMEGNIESLNASVAAALIMYESIRPRYTAGQQTGQR